MERVKLTFYVASLKMSYKDAADKRKDLALLLDENLRNTNTGKWIGGSYTKNTIEIFLAVNDYDKAFLVINSILKNYPLLPYMRIEQETG
jgi:hypothetical protein